MIHDEAHETLEADEEFCLDDLGDLLRLFYLCELARDNKNNRARMKDEK
jgi:hypothetical protein